MILFLFFPFILFGNAIENNISQVYLNNYPTIQINKIIIKNYKNKPIKNIDISNINLKRVNGTIKVDNYYIFYKIDAKIKVLISKNTISKGDSLNTSNTILKFIKFKNFYTYPVTNYTNKSAKIYIPKNRIIYDYMLEEKNLINRGETINVISKSGGIEINFQAIAMESGKKGDTIKVKKGNNFYFVKIDKNGNGKL